MYLTDEILDKLNASRHTKKSLGEIYPDEPITLSHIMTRSFAEVKALTHDTLSWGEKNFLYQQAQKELNENKMAESRIFSRANPQLAKAVRLGIQQSSMLRSYNDLFPARADSFVKPGSVASMFSPAGYLTELYREARNLHTDTSQYHLDTRRPDLASLSLSQSNMDDELSTLSLSNELCLNTIQAQESKDYNGVLEMLSTYRPTGTTPYHHHYEAVRQSIILQDPEFTVFRNNPAVAAKIDTSLLISLQTDISPDLHEILTEEITKDNVDTLLTKNFGENANVEAFTDIPYLAQYYGLTYEELASMLDLVSAGSQTDLGVQLYKEDQLVSLVNQENGNLSATLIQRTPGHNAYQFGYAELIPQGANNYLFNFTIVDHAGIGTLQVGTSGYGSAEIFSSDNFDVKEGVPISLPVTLSDEQIKKTINIGVTRRSGNYFANVNYNIISFPFEIFLLKLNKLIRLYKATGIAPPDIRSIIESCNSDLEITSDVLSKLFHVNYYIQRYGIDQSAALVLTGTNIGQTAYGNRASAFTRLFNTPALSGQEFSADGTLVTLKPVIKNENLITGVIKRGFRVSDTELYTLWCLANGYGDSKYLYCTIKNLSDLYRVSLMASIHDLSVTELAMLLAVSPYASTPLRKLSDTALSTLIGFLDRYKPWLKKMNWTVNDLYLMLTDRFSTTLTPDIENLINTLKNGLASQDLSHADEAALITAAAPFCAGATQLDSAETAVAILQWLSQLKPQQLTFTAFLTLANQDGRTADQTATLVSYCQVMGQLALIARNTGLSAPELSWAVAHPSIITEKATVLKHDIATLYELTQLHALLARCGSHATEILTSLSGKAESEQGNLAVNTAATALNLGEQVLTQALAQCSSHTYFHSWINLRDALQWIDVADSLGITPANMAMLVNLTPTSEYTDWIAASQALQAGIKTQQATLNTKLDESLSAAVSGYVIKNIAPSWVTDRDKLYNWLLIDNQVSAQINTTRIAEAIASVQLYVNRALNGQEEDVISAVKSKTFFARDWDTYNKRYSTWAGLSQLVYYPENYVDPTLRIGQTGMMDEMLQRISQSQLTSEIVEDAFKTYMTRFEEIANLDVISGYHDGVSEQSGTTYLIGRSAVGDYYWRSADIEKMSAGKLPANAWSEWKKVTAALTPVSNMVRPVIFQSRLYLTWVEERETANTSGSSTKQSTEYLLKYAHIQYDGTWSAPISIKLESGTFPLPGVSIDDTGMYCAKDMEQEMLYLYFYKKQSSYSTLPSGTAGLSLSADGQTENITASAAATMTGYIYLQFDTTAAVRLNIPYSGGSTQVNITGYTSNDRSWGDLYYTFVKWETLSVHSTEVLGDNVVIHFSATARITYSGFTGSPSRRQVDMMKKVGKMGDTFYVPQVVTTGDYASKMGFTNHCVVNQSLQEVYFDPSPSYIGYYYDVYYALANSNPTTSSITILNSDGFYTSSDSQLAKLSQDIYVCRSNPFPSAGADFKYSHFQRINTNISLGNVMISFGNQLFSADECSEFTFEKSLFNFNNKSVTIPLTAFTDNTAQIALTMKVGAIFDDSRKTLGSEIRTLTLTRLTESSMPVISLNKITGGAQYLQYGVYRVRVNTLFAKQLVARANKGLNAVLSMETQRLEEPKMGKGFYANFVLPPYDASTHGNSRNFTLNLINPAVDSDAHMVYSGMLTDSELSVTLFIPVDEDPMAIAQFNNYCATIILQTQKTRDDESKGISFIYDPNSSEEYRIDKNSTFSLFQNVTIQDVQDEPMDFSGANALYFWEMFYYVPMMAFKRLLSESKFTEATQWIQYVWNPDGYLVNDQPATWVWNVRPLEEETTWHASPLDSVDQDAVAQADPLHYKVATFMSYLDLLIARGDAAYRQLERDTLNEAKMWYVQAMDILGDEPYLSGDKGWDSPSLSDAASKTVQSRTQHALMEVRQQIAPDKLGTANSLTKLFLPQQNDKLTSYWQTLAQRLYNLRHNLTIDGNPLSLSVYATPAAPISLLSAAVNASAGGTDLPSAVMPPYRFPVILESARGIVEQLIQFGSTVLSITERRDAETLSELLQTQGAELVRQSIALQNRTISEIDADKATLEVSLSGAQSRLDSYTSLYDEDVNTGETQAMDLALSASVLSTTATVSYTVAAGLDAIPNIYGMAFGGSRYGSVARAVGTGIEIGAAASRTAAERLNQSETYRRRRQEWEIQRNAAQSEVNQINAQLDALAVRREGAELQKTYLETQQSQTQSQMTFLQNRFTNKALYNWLRGKLTAIYYQFYDLTVSRCLMAQKAYQWELGNEMSFIRPGTWQGTYAGLMAGETLMLNLAQMEQRYLEKDQRKKEVTRTVCLSEVYAGLASGAFTLADQIVTLVTAGNGSSGTDGNGLSVTSDKQLQATLTLSDLKIGDDYPSSLGKIRRIKQISVTLPALVGPYQDVRAALSFGDPKGLAKGCDALAVSHGMNDSGQFQLDFNDGRWLPFEGIPVDSSGVFTLSFPQADSSQKDLLLSLADIILHIRYTIAS